jgi:hypothetical protein
MISSTTGSVTGRKHTCANSSISSVGSGVIITAIRWDLATVKLSRVSIIIFPRCLYHLPGAVISGILFLIDMKGAFGTVCGE